MISILRIFSDSLRSPDISLRVILGAVELVSFFVGDTLGFVGSFGGIFGREEGVLELELVVAVEIALGGLDNDFEGGVDILGELAVPLVSIGLFLLLAAAAAASPAFGFDVGATLRGGLTGPFAGPLVAIGPLALAVN